MLPNPRHNTVKRTRPWTALLLGLLLVGLQVAAAVHDVDLAAHGDRDACVVCLAHASGHAGTVPTPARLELPLAPASAPAIRIAAPSVVRRTVGPGARAPPLPA